MFTQAEERKPFSPGDVNRKISDEDVARLRHERQQHPELSWKELLELVDIPISPKRAYKICTGREREAAPGPISDLSRERAKSGVCQFCGKTVELPCRECHGPMWSWMIDALVEAGLADETMVDDCVKERRCGDPAPACVAWSAYWMRRNREVQEQESQEAEELALAI